MKTLGRCPYRVVEPFLRIVLLGCREIRELWWASKHGQSLVPSTAELGMYSFTEVTDPYSRHLGISDLTHSRRGVDRAVLRSCLLEKKERLFRTIMRFHYFVVGLGYLIWAP